MPDGRFTASECACESPTTTTVRGNAAAVVGGADPSRRSASAAACASARLMVVGGPVVAVGTLVAVGAVTVGDTVTTGAGTSGAVTDAIGNYGLYAVFLLMLVDAVLPAASEVVMVYAGAVASGAFAGQAILKFPRVLEDGNGHPA